MFCHGSGVVSQGSTSVLMCKECDGRGHKIEDRIIIPQNIEDINEKIQAHN